MFEYIIPSKTRRKILSLYFSDITKIYHLRRVAREVGEEINAVKRELDILEKEGLLKKEKRLNRVIFYLNPKYLFFEELLRIFIKQTNLSQKIIKNASRLGKVKYAVFSHKFIKKQKTQEGEILLLFVGTIVIPEISAIIAEEEKQTNSEINFTVMTEEEFAFRKKSNDPFIWAFLKQPKLMILGDEGGLTT
jgi:hypothetical protein